jgi:hypothetical protein
MQVYDTGFVTVSPTNQLIFRYTDKYWDPYVIDTPMISSTTIEGGPWWGGDPWMDNVPPNVWGLFVAYVLSYPNPYGMQTNNVFFWRPTGSPYDKGRVIRHYNIT